MSRRKAIAAAVRRLHGAWRSDQEKTVNRWVFPKRIAGRKLKLWRNMFGKNEWRFTQTRVYGTFEDQRSVSLFKVLWADEWSAVVLFQNKDGERVHHIFFDGEWFYLLAGRDIVEYFRRID